ncbi:class I SAM-dependent methyltransferase [Geodermatophilus normandii]|uniref:Class I SAM-dependent methyltransferase n=1 Tax=Geodermatophilus normandii TaxID=1137989 RepID=A0A6P0GH98_9ACTN|nr:class I SAM-dependent methyltransferase [Geodermatophilus normandii]NEM06647.1 class I SAM-dependent methyltransferase [Geodermatophilus normandii]NEM08371.1 class I SAM-dependent methyltransferase [Geodermatophilus normandii]
MDWDTYAQKYRQLDDESTVPPLLRRVLDGSSGTLIDVGCGEGALLDRLRAGYGDSWTLTGYEVSGVRAEMARSHGHTVHTSPDGVVPVEDGAFDVATASHVIEHVPDDGVFARELLRITRPGGFVYVETPVKLPGAWYFRRNPQAGWVLDSTHVREYRSAAAVNEVLAGAGLTVVAEDLTPISYPLAAAGLLVRRVLRLPQSTKRPSGLAARSVSIPRYRQQAVLTQRPEPPVA